MITPTPDFMDWVEVTLDGWKLKEGAPPEVVEKYNEYMGKISNRHEGK